MLNYFEVIKTSASITSKSAKRTACLFAVVSTFSVHATPSSDIITISAPLDSPLTTVTSTKAPRQPVPASDGSDLLKSIPGFSQVRNGGSNGDPVLRGMFGSRLNILTNGGAIYGGCGGRMDAPTSYISPASFDLLTVIKGPQTVIWGPMASAGTVLFESKPENITQPTFNGEANLLVGSQGRFDQNIDTTLGGESGYLKLAAGKSRADDYRDGNGLKVPSHWDKWNADLSLGITPDNDSLAELSLGTGDGEARYGGRGMDGAQFLRKSAGLLLEKRNISETLSALSWRIYYNHADHIMDNYSLRDASSGMKMASRVDRTTYGSRISSTWQGPVHQLVAGLDTQSSSHRSNGMTQWKKNASLNQSGLFAELTTETTTAAKIISGARVDRWQVKDLRMPEASRTEILPGAFTRYEMTSATLPLKSYIGVGYTERMPDYWEMFSSAGNINHVRTEKTTQFDFGTQYKGENTEAWFAGYLGQVNDFIVFDYATPSKATRNVNAQIMGAELGSAYALSERWKLEATLAWAWGNNRSDHQPLPQIPPVDSRLTLNYAGNDWNSSLLLRLVSAQTRVARDSGNVTGKDMGPSAGFGVVSWNVDYALTQQVKLNGGVDNLFNKQYAEHLNMAGNKDFGFSAQKQLPEPGRNVWASIQVKF
ncbi:TonB-dependent copper receptor [Rouxiella silvae]|uniref:TonB-dependent copper receptor n=1 Tax=Rouxiella silvae TaxID=1646373 RepID=A0AA40X6X3_9GAMM|nr:TonB-dependent copper receptor [Rouxiella silvae]MBF6639625.1 TonB-dependent copper receptor [Rouxiella silvae]